MRPTQDRSRSRTDRMNRVQGWVLCALSALVVAIVVPPVVLAQIATPVAPLSFVRWSPTTESIAGAGTDVIGAIEEPAPNSIHAADVDLPVRGWAVDRYSATRPDRVLVYDGGPPEAGGPLVAELQPYVWRFDVGNLLGSSAYKVSGFEGVISPRTLAPGPHTLTVAAHLGELGWWTASVRVVLGRADVPDGAARFDGAPAPSADGTPFIAAPLMPGQPAGCPSPQTFCARS